MRCDAVSEKLDAFRTGELGRSELEEITAHLASCGSCLQELADIQRIATRARGMRASAPEAIFERILMSIGDRYAELETDLGRMWVGFNARGITMVYPRAQEAKAFEDSYEKRIGRRPLRSAIPKSYARSLQRAAAGTLLSDTPVDLSSLSPFEQKVLLLLRRIPRGEVRPYAWLAREAGRPQAVRAVGNAMARNPIPFLLPCHRVVPTAGGIGNYAFGSALKRELLLREEAPVDEIEQLGRAGVRYVGCRSTNIYCFPTCHDARRMRPENRVPLRSVKEADAAGYRPCRHCKPLAVAS
jgi:O-6-methylguanine DNA methyltransferase